MKEAVANHAWFAPQEIEIISNNPRTKDNSGFSQEKMDRLEKGIARDGLNHALLICMPDGNPRLVAGERRIRAILNLIEKDQDALDKKIDRILCKNPHTGKMEPALEVYKTVECKVTECKDDRDRRRQAIQENTLHEPLTDFELLKQVDQMEKDGFSRAEQAETMGMSEAWISQSHSLLDCHAKVLEYMSSEKLTRTAAINFINIPKDKHSEVLEKAAQKTYKEVENKEVQARGELDEAMKEIGDNNDLLTVTQFTGNQEGQRKARRAINKASRKVAKAQKKIKSAGKNKKKKISVDTVTSAAKEVNGAGDKLRRPQPMKQIRQICRDLEELLEKGELVNPENGNEYAEKDVFVVRDVLSWVLSENDLKHPLDCLKPAGKKK